MTRETTRRVLGRDATFRIGDAPACAGRAREWADLERRHRLARTRDEVGEVISEMSDRWCAHCPVLGRCHDWAVADEYTGLAAGRPYLMGKPKPWSWISTQPANAEDNPPAPVTQLTAPASARYVEPTAAAS